MRRFASNESLRLFDNDLIREERRRMAKKVQQQQEMILRQRSESYNLYAVTIDINYYSFKSSYVMIVMESKFKNY